MATINATYKRYNGTSWDTIYFATSAAQVGESSSRFFIKSSNTVNGKAFTQNGGITLYGDDIKLTSDVNTTIAGYFTSLGQNVASHVNATNNPHSVTKAQVGLGNVENTALSTWAGSSNLTTFSGGTFGGAAAKGVETSLTDTHNNVPTSAAVKSFVESKGYTTNTGNVTGSSLTSGKIVVGNADNNSSSKITVSSYSVNDIVDIAEGKTETYVTTAYPDEDHKYILTGTTNITTNTTINSTFLSSNTVSKLDIASGNSWNSISEYPNGQQTQQTIYLYIVKNNQGSYQVVESISLTDAHTGDIVLVTQTDVPDLWIDKTSIPLSHYVRFNKLETTKVDLSSYSTKSETVTGVSYSSNKLQKTINGSTTDIMNLGISSGVITIGGNSITPLTSHQTMYYRPVQVEGAQKLANTANTALNFINTGNVTFTYDSGIKASVDLSGYLPTSTTYLKSASVSGNTLTITKKDDTTITFKGTQIHYATSEPSSGMNTGDVLIQYTA